jgi:hypothetical protein
MREQRKGEGGGVGERVDILARYNSLAPWGDPGPHHFTSTLDMQAIQVRYMRHLAQPSSCYGFLNATPYLLISRQSSSLSLLENPDHLSNHAPDIFYISTFRFPLFFTGCQYLYFWQKSYLFCASTFSSPH